MDLAPPISPSCLIVDDDVVVAMDLEERIAEAGFNARWVNSVKNASAIIETLTPDIVVLDVMVGSRTSTPFAQALRARGIPFVVHSGYTPCADLSGFTDAPWVRKPVDTSEMVKALRGLLNEQPLATGNPH